MAAGYIDITPLMQSATTPSGYEVTASSENGGRSGYKAFDGTHTSSNIWHSNANMPQWVQMKFPRPCTVQMFSIQNPPADQYGAAGIIDFELQGSINGLSYTTLGIYTNDPANDLVNGFTVQNPGKYQYYRIYVTSSGYKYNGTPYCQISEIRFYAKESVALLDGNAIGATIIEDTTYGITTGKTMIGGTAYIVEQGKTLVGGTAYGISIGPGAIPVTITGTGNGTYCYVTINEETYTAAASGIEVLPGDIISFTVNTNFQSYRGKIVIDGENVAIKTGKVTYEWTVPECESIGIELDYKTAQSGFVKYGYITVNTI